MGYSRSGKRERLARLRPVEDEFYLANTDHHPLFEEILDNGSAVYIRAVFAFEVEEHIAGFELLYPCVFTRDRIMGNNRIAFLTSTNENFVAGQGNLSRDFRNRALPY